MSTILVSFFNSPKLERIVPCFSDELLRHTLAQVDLFDGRNHCTQELQYCFKSNQSQPQRDCSLLNSVCSNWLKGNLLFDSDIIAHSLKGYCIEYFDFKSSLVQDAFYLDPAAMSFGSFHLPSIKTWKEKCE